MPHDANKGSPVSLLACLPSMVAICEQHGYNLAVQGSMVRDYDLIAIAWTHKATPPEQMVTALAEFLDGVIPSDPTADPYDFTKNHPEPKPHGRLAWTIRLKKGPIVDLSVILPEENSVEKLMERIDAHVARLKAG